MKIHPCWTIKVHRCHTEKTLTWFDVVCQNWIWPDIWRGREWYVFVWLVLTDMMGIMITVRERCSVVVVSLTAAGARVETCLRFQKFSAGNKRLSLCDLHTLSLCLSVSLGVRLASALKMVKVRKKELFGLWTSQKHPDSYWCLCLFKMSSTHKELFKRDRKQPKKSVDPCCFFLVPFPFFF